jgi:hypothetical protein
MGGATMRKRNGHPAQQLGLAFIAGSVMFCLSTAPAQAASPSVELKRIFSKMDRDLCRSLSLATCKRATAQKKRKAKPVKTVKSVPRKDRPAKSTPVSAKPAPEVKAVERKPANDQIPVPVLKPVELTKHDSAPVTPVIAKPAPEVNAVERKPANDKIPVPVLKPVEVTKHDSAPVTPKVVVTAPPLPAKPPEVKVVILPAPAVPMPKVYPPAPHGMPDGTPQGEACYDSLTKLGVEFTRLTTPVGTGACSVSDAVQMRSMSIAGQVVKLPDQPTFNCGFAVKFAGWIKDAASPIVTKATESKIATLGTGPGFQCRGRNGDSTAKISEHGFGNAVDIERVKLANGETVEIKDAMTIGAKYQPVLATLRASACQYFTTVLGPGANAAHAEHFHFDLARRGKKGNHAMCQ